MDKVIDASVAVAWFAPHQADAMTDGALVAVTEQGGLVPAHFGHEVLRSLRRLQRRGAFDATHLAGALTRLQLLPLKEDETSAIQLLPEIQRLAASLGIASGDAGYLELARRRGAALATRDAALAAAAKASGVALFQP